MPLNEHLFVFNCLLISNTQAVMSVPLTIFTVILFSVIKLRLSDTPKREIIGSVQIVQNDESIPIIAANPDVPVIETFPLFKDMADSPEETSPIEMLRYTAKDMLVGVRFAPIIHILSPDPGKLFIK
jgi:hypothetical protein